MNPKRNQRSAECLRRRNFGFFTPLTRDFGFTAVPHLIGYNPHLIGYNPHNTSSVQIRVDFRKDLIRLEGSIRSEIGDIKDLITWNLWMPGTNLCFEIRSALSLLREAWIEIDGDHHEASSVIISNCFACLRIRSPPLRANVWSKHIPGLLWPLSAHT
eukprot:scaffold1135_cov150-Ochromonas_danica.AAC.2